MTHLPSTEGTPVPESSMRTPDRGNSVIERIGMLGGEDIPFDPPKIVVGLRPTDLS